MRPFYRSCKFLHAGSATSPSILSSPRLGTPIQVGRRWWPSSNELLKLLTTLGQRGNNFLLPSDHDQLRLRSLAHPVDRL